MTEVYDGKSWDRWEYEEARLVLVYHSSEGWEYEIDLERCNNSLDILDWILQISHKGWATPEDIGYFVLALDELAGNDLQRLCSKGEISFKTLLS